MMGDARAGGGEEASRHTGREREIAELHALVRPGRALTLHGPAGLGKTWLLRRLVAGLGPDYPDGAVLVRLADLREPVLLAARVAAAVGVVEEPGVPLPEIL